MYRVHLFRDLENERNEDVIWRKIMDTPAPLITKTFYEEDASQNHPIFQELEGLGLRLLFKKEQMSGWYVEEEWVGSASYVYVSSNHPNFAEEATDDESTESNHSVGGSIEQRCPQCQGIECYCESLY